MVENARKRAEEYDEAEEIIGLLNLSNGTGENRSRQALAFFGAPANNFQPRKRTEPRSFARLAPRLGGRNGNHGHAKSARREAGEGIVFIWPIPE
jgi:hypothetical protein